MHKILEDIVYKKRRDIATAKLAVPLGEQEHDATYVSSFYSAIQGLNHTAIIAEIKLASPTHPVLGSQNDILKRAHLYQQGGATALSFITEQHYFKSHPKYLQRLKNATTLPILQKDFVIDEYQIHEARMLGSDAILLIARLTDEETLRKFTDLANKLGIEPVIEVDNEVDLERALRTKARCIAVNARDLGTFTIDMHRACHLISKIPNNYLRLGFSGVSTVDDVQAYRSSGANVVLVGTALMKARNVTQKLQELQS